MDRRSTETEAALAMERATQALEQIAAHERECANRWNRLWWTTVSGQSTIILTLIGVLWVLISGKLGLPHP